MLAVYYIKQNIMNTMNHKTLAVALKCFDLNAQRSRHETPVKLDKWVEMCTLQTSHTQIT